MSSLTYRVVSVARKGIVLRHLAAVQTCVRSHSQDSGDGGVRKATTPIGRLDKQWEGKNEKMEPKQDVKEDDPYAPFPGSKNPETGEIGGPKGPEPTRYGDWERKGRVIDF